MNLLINASNIRKSGALQVTLSFLEEVKKIPRHQYLIVISEEVEQQIDITSFPPNYRIVSLSIGTPGSAGFMQQVNKLRSLEKEFRADCVFSVFAPVYWTPTAPHLAGFAYPWIINPDSLFIRGLPLKQRVKALLENTFKKYFFRKNSRYHVVEEDDVKRRLSKYFAIKEENIYVVNNTCSHHFYNPAIQVNPTLHFPEKKPGQFCLVTISSNFPHKNLQIIAGVSQQLQRKGYDNIFFYVTIKSSEFEELFRGNDHIRNLGVVASADCPYVYTQADAMLLPTMLECFSASYPEAMIMKKPILTSDLSFARSICGDAAIYFDPLDAADIADKIIGLINDKALYNRLVENGIKKLATYPSAFERAEKYIEICEEIVVRESRN